MQIIGVDYNDVLTVIKLKSTWLVVINNLDMHLSKKLISHLHVSIAFQQALQNGYFITGNVSILATNHQSCIAGEKKYLMIIIKY